jgi:nicotinate-nucleotide pyrophosphorylase (carboxylating)
MDLAITIEENVRQALAEDIGAGDLTASLIPAEKPAIAAVISRENAVLCGAQWFDACFRQLSPEAEVHWFARDGEAIGDGQQLCEIKGNARALLTAERTALNFLQLLSAVATQTRRYTDAVAGTGAIIVDTRKTLPGLRLAQKYAVRCGGGHNHRYSLSDAVMAKDNHLAVVDDIGAAIRRARAELPHTMHVEVEIDRLGQLDDVLAAGPDTIMLDNFSLDDLVEGVRRIDGRAIVEASGGITLDAIAAVAATGVDVISVGALTHSVRALDLGLDVVVAGAR